MSPAELRAAIMDAVEAYGQACMVVSAATIERDKARENAASADAYRHYAAVAEYTANLMERAL